MCIAGLGAAYTLILIRSINMIIYHFVYKTFHINGKYYIGRHSTKNLDDGYLGSGKWVKSIKDKNELNREILSFAETFDDLLILEEKLIIENIDDEFCMNYCASSLGFPYGKLNPMYKIPKEKNPNYKRKPTEEQLIKMRKPKSDSSNMGKYERTPEIVDKMKNSLVVVRNTKEYKEKRSKLSSRKWLIIDQNGNEYEIQNLKKFCGDNNLNYSCMKFVNENKIKSHKGFKCKKLN